MTTSPNRSLLLGLALLPAIAIALITASGCCGGREAPEDPEAKKRKELALLEAEEANLARATAAIERGDYALLTLGPAEIEAAARNALPLTLSAGTLNEHVSGTITISSLENARIQRGKLVFDLVGKGKDIRVSSAGQLFLGKKKVDAYVRAVEGGMTVRVEGTASAKNGDLLFQGRAAEVRLKKEAGLAKDIKNALNGSFFQKPHAIDLGAFRAGNRNLAARAALVVDDSVAVVFAP